MPIIWVRVPKCGATSFLHVLRENGMQARNLKKVQCAGIDNLNHLKNEVAILTGPNGNSYYDYASVRNTWSFAVVRNPWARVVSAWRFCTLLKNKTLRRVLQELPHKNQFDGIYADADPSELKSAWYHLTLPQVQFVKDRQGNMRPNRIIKLEEIAVGMDPVWDHLGLPKQEMPRLNTSGHPRYTEYYDAKTRKMVDRLFEEDIQTFGYSFGL